MLDYYEMNVGRDNFDFEGSEDQKNFAAWRGDPPPAPVGRRLPRRRNQMSVVALEPYSFPAKDARENFPAPLLYIGWEDHLMFCAPVLPAAAARHAVRRAGARRCCPASTATTPTSRRSTGRRCSGSRAASRWTPDPAKSLADNGLKHKDAIRFRTPGLTGIKGSFS